MTIDLIHTKIIQCTFIYRHHGPVLPCQSTNKMLHPECRRRLVHALRTRYSVTSLAPSTAASSSFHPMTSSSRRQFTTTPKQSSHIGSAPLSVPASVDLQVLSPIPSSSMSMTKRNAARREVVPQVQVKGPLGELVYPLAPGIKVDYNERLRKAIVSIDDRGVKQQRAMWGMPLVPFQIFPII